jgi:hypothetical protein
VLEKAGEESYWIQRIPVLQELNRRPGVKQKQAAWRLERIPSSVVVHKRMDTCDTRWVQQNANLVSDNPLEHNLGFFDFGKYHKAPDTAKYAFNKVGNLLGYDLDSDDEEDDDEVEENDDGLRDGEVSEDIPQPSDKDAQPSSAINVNPPVVA